MEGGSDMANKIKNKVFGFLSKGRNIVMTILVVLFVLLCVYGYKNYVSPKLEPDFKANKEFVPKDSEEQAVLMFFYTDWCPHCKKAKPVWNNVKEEYDQKVINNTKLIFKDINCEKEEEMANKYNIEGYPTIKLQKNNQIIEFDAKPEENALVQFIESTL